MLSNKEILVKIEQLKVALIARARGEHTEQHVIQYAAVRDELVELHSIREKLPIFVLSYRNLQEFWRFIQPKYKSYAERESYIQQEFVSLLNFLEFEKDSDNDEQISDLFQYQFPAGLPFGLQKPNMAFIPEKGTQKPKFEGDENIGILKSDVYPSLNFTKLNKHLENTPFLKTKGLYPALIVTNQTESERKFFFSYQSRFTMSTADVPVLIPQAWIQWHSSTKRDLRSQSSSYADDLYRVDFVVFWNNKRFAILLDDIGHYAKKVGTTWQADEENYSKRLKEDRKLRKEGWNVFRTSNWEMRNEAFINEALDDLHSFIGFEIPKPPETDFPF